MSSNLTLPLPAGIATPISETTLGRQGEQEIVVLKGGQSVAIWHTATAGGNFYEIYARRLDAAGQPVGPEFLVNTTRALDQYLPEVAALEDGGFVVVWHSVEFADEVAFNGNPFLYTLFSQRFAADGTPVGHEQTINADLYEDPYGVDVVALAGGGYLVWGQFSAAVSNTVGGGYFRIFGADGGPEGTSVLPEPFLAGGELGAQVEALTGGGFAIMKYHANLQGDGIDFEVRAYSAAGVQEGTTFEMSTAGQVEYDMKLVALTGGGFLVTWEAADPNDYSHAFARVFGADGMPVGGNFRIDSPTAINSAAAHAIALADGGFVVTWSEGNRIMGQLYSETGLALSSQTVVVESAQLYTFYNPTHSLHELPGGEILITWLDRDGLYGRLMEADGRMHPGAATLVPAFYAARNIEVTVLADGRIAITFESWFGAPFGDIQDVQVLTVELNLLGGLQGGYSDGADARQLLGASAVVHALDGDDVVITGVNGDTVYGGRGQDYLVGGRADDKLIGGSGNDTLAAGKAPDQDWSLADRLYGGSGDDLLIRYSGADRLYGGAGNDTFVGIGSGIGAKIYGGLGDDLIRAPADQKYGGAGNDTMSFSSEITDGGEGTDTVIYEYESRDGSPIPSGFISIDLNGTVTVGEYSTFQISGFENAHISGFVSGKIMGNVLDNHIQTDVGAIFRNADSLHGREGNDTLIAGGGDDTLVGGFGDDTLNGGLDADWLYGGAGFDLASYAGALAGVRVDLVNTSDRGGEAIGDQMFSIEGLIGSAHGDFLAGTNQANRLEGGAGGDRLIGLAGNDTMSGGAGNDTLSGGAGNDVLTGRSANDLINGGVEVDVFLFNYTLNARRNVDTITTFSSTDSIHLDRAIFTAIGHRLTIDEFRIIETGTSLAAVDSTDHIVYVKSTGRLLYDADANGAEKAVLFAELADGTNLNFINFLLV